MLRIQIVSRNLPLLQAQGDSLRLLGWKSYSNIELLFLNDQHKLYTQRFFTPDSPRTPDHIRKLQ